MSAPDLYTVTVEGPDGALFRRVFSPRTVGDFMAGPQEPHAKAAYLASIEIQAASDRRDLASEAERL